MEAANGWKFGITQTHTHWHQSHVFFELFLLYMLPNESDNHGQETCQMSRFACQQRVRWCPAKTNSHKWRWSYKYRATPTIWTPKKVRWNQPTIAHVFISMQVCCETLRDLLGTRDWKVLKIMCILPLGAAQSLHTFSSFEASVIGSLKNPMMFLHTSLGFSRLTACPAFFMTTNWEFPSRCLKMCK
jgi:hypothetical protein